MEQTTYTFKDAAFWKMTISLALASFFVFAGMYAVQPLLPAFVKIYDVSIAMSSMSVSLTIIGLIIGLIMLGFFSDRYGRTVFIKLSIFGSVIPFFIMPFTDSFILLLLLRLIQGFAMAGLPAGALAYLNEETDKRSAGIATTLYISSNALGGMAGRVLTGHLVDSFSLKTAFLTLAFIGLLVVVAVLTLLPKSRYFKPSKLSFGADIKEFAVHLKNPLLLQLFGLGLILQLSFTGLWTYLPFYLQAEPFSLPLQVVSNMFMAYGLGVIGSPLAGWLAGHFGLQRIRTMGILLLSIGLCLTLSHTVVVIVVGLCIACLGFFTAHALTAADVTEQAPHHKGSASSLYFVSYYIGVTLGSSALSPLWLHFGWIGLMLSVGGLPVIYVGLIWVIRHFKHREALGN